MGVNNRRGSVWIEDIDGEQDEDEDQELEFNKIRD